MKKDCYQHLSHLPLLDEKYVNEALNATYSHIEPSGDMAAIKNKFNRWISSKSAYSTFEETKFCKDLEAQFGQVVSHYAKFDPRSLYDWHTDSQRQCSINVLIRPVVNALTLFKYAEMTKEHSLIYHLDECEYVPRVPVLFNSSVHHCVINLSNETRYLLTISFERTVTFYHVRDFLLNYKTESY